MPPSLSFSSGRRWSILLISLGLAVPVYTDSPVFAVALVTPGLPVVCDAGALMVDEPVVSAQDVETSVSEVVPTDTGVDSVPVEATPVDSVSSQPAVVVCPGVVTGVVATAGLNAVSLSWVAPVNVDAASVTGYVVDVRSELRVVSVPVGQTSVEITGLPNGVEARFVVYAVGPDGAGPASEEVSATPTTGVEGEVAGIIVKFTDPVVVGDTVTVDGPLGVSAEFAVVDEVADDVVLVELDEAVSVAEAERIADDLESQGEVAWAEPDQFVFTATPDTAQPVAVPSDAEWSSSQWNLWDTFGIGVGDGAGSMTEAWAAGTGAGSVVAVIDTGITSHPDLDGQLVSGFDFVSNPEQLAAVRESGGVPVAFDGDYVDEGRFGGLGRDADPSDPGDWRGVVPVRGSSWHGTAMAGVIAAQSNTTGITGVAPGARIQPVRALSWRGGLLSDIAAAITWSSGGSVDGAPVNATPSNVINLSFAVETACPNSLQSAIDEALSRGAVLVAAAGNANANVAGFAPANCDGVIAVGATGRDGLRAPYSNWGSGVDVSAPGGSTAGGVLTTSNAGATTPGAASYGNDEGTSIASAHVAGAAAVLRGANPTLSLAEVVERLTGEEFAKQFGGVTCDADTTKSCGAGILSLAEIAMVRQGAVDYAMTFSRTSNGYTNGTNSYASAAASGFSSITGDATFEAWVKPRSFTASRAQGVVALGPSGIYADGTTQWIFRVDSSSGLTDLSVPISRTGAWVHLALTRRASDGEMRAYVDGQLVSTGTRSGNLDAGALLVGAYPGWDSLDGAIDEVRIWTSVRSETEIRTDMRTYGPILTNGAATSNLFAYYDFNEGSGTTVFNRASGAASTTHVNTVNSPNFVDVKTTSTSGSDTFVTFTRSYLTSAGGWVVPQGVSSLDVAVVGAGGAGGWNAAAGGGGGGRVQSNITDGSGTVRTVTVGQGGFAYGWANNTNQAPIDAFYSANPNVGAGQSSVFGSLTANGGSRGQSRGWDNSATMQGGAGGSGSSGSGGSGGSAVGLATNGGNGSAGYTLSTPFSGDYGGGGGGGAGWNPTPLGGAAGNSAAGQGGNYNNAGASAVANRGGGGGGGAGNGYVGGHGGSGVVMVRYATSSVRCTPERVTEGSYTILAFKDVGTCTWSVPAGVTNVDYLVVAGGGGGGTDVGGGGGAGGLTSGSMSVSAVSSATIIVGTGGAGGTSAQAASGQRGANGGGSSFVAATTVSVLGGGGGAAGGTDNATYNGLAGGSGGGSSVDVDNTGGAGTAGQGNAGAKGNSSCTTSSNTFCGGGGGGAGAAGGVPTRVSPYPAGAGGIGTASALMSVSSARSLRVGEASGTSVYFAGGGGGGAVSSAQGGPGGLGGGGTGDNQTRLAGFDGLANTGGGGGGGGRQASTPYTSATSGGDGGSGVVILRYEVQDTDYAMDFNGSTQLARSSVPGVSTTATIETWVKPESACSNAQNVLIKDDAYSIYCLGGVWRFRFKTASGAAWQDYSTGASVRQNQWQHIALARDVAGVHTFFLDGQPVFQQTFANSAWFQSSFDLGVGAYVGLAEYFNGHIDELKIWSSARTQAQVAAGMHARPDVADANLKAYYDFNEGTGTTIYNRVAGAVSTSHLTSSNGPTFVDVKTVNVLQSGRSVVTFPRSYINAAGGWATPQGVTSAEVLVVGGGGGAAWNSGGGGSGGGVSYSAAASVSGAIAVVVGHGGRASSSNAVNGGAGGQSSFGTMTVAGGNGGFSYNSGGAGGASVSGSGAGGAGSRSSTQAGSAGGNGPSYSIEGSLKNYAGGGGGGGWASSTAGGAGGAGGGGRGGGTGGVSGVSGTVNSGGGGGSGADSVSSTVSGNGGSGVVIVSYVLPSGGLTTTCTNPATSEASDGSGDIVVKFTAVESCTWTPPVGVTTVQALVVGGGGGGGAHVGGGGGGGGVRDGTIAVSGSVSVTVGDGGNGFFIPDGAASVASATLANPGGSSSFGSLTAAGGGHGGSWTWQAPSSGGSGGGAGTGSGASGNNPATTPAQGFAGGNGQTSNFTNYATGGGGGAGSVGANWVDGNTSGAGGSGKSSSITGTSVVYGGGGGGGIHGGVAGTLVVGAGGNGGGGAGNGYQSSSCSATTTNGGICTGGNGTDGLGGGGGGSGGPWGAGNPSNSVSSRGGDGGSGIVIVRYTPADSSCTPFTYTSGAYTVVEFQTAGTCTWTVPSGISAVDVLAVGGGGGGGAWVGGGGGGGGVTETNGVSVTAGSRIDVVVGAGGVGASITSTFTNGANGQSSRFGSASPVIALGGGVGASVNSQSAGTGSSVATGGGGANTSWSAGSGTGSGTTLAGGSSPRDSQPHPVGGGAGAGGNGLSGSSAAPWVSGAGGPGKVSSLTGATVHYGGGGGGSAHGEWTVGPSWVSSVAITPGVGGMGGGGAGGRVVSSSGAVYGADGVDGLGGGGGGSANYGPAAATPSYGGDGGDGIVIVRYQVQQIPTFTWSNVSKTFGDAAYTISAPTPSTPGTFTYASSDSSVISIIGTTATVAGAGTATITATFTPTDQNTYMSGGTVTQTVTVAQGAQSALTVTSTSGTYGTAITLATSGGSGTGAVTYAVSNGTATGCTETNGELTSSTAGSCTVTATKAQDDDYLVESSSATTVNIAKKNLTISGVVVNNKQFDGGQSATLDLSSASLVGVASWDNSVNVAIDSSGASASFTSSAVGSNIPVTVSGFALSGNKASSSYTLSQPSGLAADISTGTRTLAFGTTSYTKTYGDSTFTVTATPSAGSGTLNYSASGTACTVGQLTGVVTVAGQGSCQISATIATDGSYGQASTTTSVTVTVARATVTITASSPSVTYGDSVPTITPSYNGFVNGENQSVLTTAPTCSTVYTPTSSASTTPVTSCSGAVASNYDFQYTPGAVTITKATQTISFANPAPSGATYGDPAIPVAPTATSGLVVMLNSSNTAICTVSGGGINVVRAGSCTITASQSGNDNFFAASNVAHTFTIDRANQDVLTLTSASTLIFGQTLTLASSGGSGTGAVSYLATDGTATGCSASTSLNYTTVGTCFVTAYKASDSNYVGANSTTQTVTITQAGQTLAFTSVVPVSPVSGGTYTPTAIAVSTVTGLSSGVVPSFGVAGSCSIANGVVTFTASGNCVVTASAAGNTNFTAAVDVVQTIVVGSINQNITFAQPSNVAFGSSSVSMGATASSDLTVTYALGVGTTNSACSVSALGVVTVLAVGTCEVVASQVGDAQFAAASSVTRAFQVVPALPTAPSLASASAGSQSITVAFTAPGFTGGVSVQAYAVVATPTLGGVAVIDTSCVASPCTIAGLANGASYTVTVAAINSAGTGPASGATGALTPATSAFAVAALSAVPGDAVVDLSWTALTNAQLGGGTFIRYEVSYRPAAVSSNSVQVAAPAAWIPAPATNALTSQATNSYRVTGLNNGTSYDFQVVAITSANATEIPGNTAQVVQYPSTAPSAPQAPTVLASTATDVQFSWSAPLFDGGSVLTSPFYAVTVTSTTPGAATPITCTRVQTTDMFCTATGLTNGAVYTFSVTAQNRMGNSPAGTDIYAAPSSDATLSNLVVNGPSAAVTLAPVFAPGTTAYTATVDNAIASVTVTPTSTMAGSTITVNGVAVVSGSASGSIALNVAVNQIVVVVTASDPRFSETYTIDITRGAAPVFAGPTPGDRPKEPGPGNRDLPDPDTKETRPNTPVTIDPITSAPPADDEWDTDTMRIVDPVTEQEQTTVVTPDGTWELDTRSGLVNFTPAAGFYGRAEVEFVITTTKGVTYRARLSVFVARLGPTIPVTGTESNTVLVWGLWLIVAGALAGALSRRRQLF